MWQTQTPTLTVMSLHIYSCTTEVKTELLKFNLPKFLTGKNLNVTGSELADGCKGRRCGAKSFQALHDGNRSSQDLTS